MSRIFITGSADGLGQLAAKELIRMGHQVVLHARSDERGEQAIAAVPGAESVLSADLSNMEETKQLASKVNALGHFDAVIHNAAVYRSAPEQICSVNVLAPYILTCLIDRPGRLIYMSSGMHRGGNVDLGALRNDPSKITYSDSKLYMVMLANVVARHWPTVYANSLDPGWVPTKMGGSSAPDSLKDGYATQVWLAVSDDPAAKVSGRYFKHKRIEPTDPQADDMELQEKFLDVCGDITRVRLD